MFAEHKEAGEVTEAPAKVLKLSEAIRIGCARYPRQCTSGLYYSAEDSGSACVWGAAAYGMATDVRSLHCAENLAARVFRKAHGFTLMAANDKFGWTREAIADWLEAQGY